MPISIRQLAPSFAAEIRGVDLRHMPSQAVLDEIYDAFLEYGVIVLPGQALDLDQQLAFGRLFGPLHVLPPMKGPKRRIEDRAIDDVSNLKADGSLAGANSEKAMFALGNQLWHSDLSFCDNPAHASMLHATEIAEEGGETEFCDLVSAYETLDREMKAKIEGKIAVHSLAHSRVRGGHSEADVEYLLELRPPASQPLVRTHPETGKKALFIGAHVSKIEGLDETESADLIDTLLDHAPQPERVYSHRWAVNDLVIWDNRQTLHRGRPYDVDNVRRVMHRVTVDGDGPNVVDGKTIEPEIRRRPVRVPA
ncbi:TauD/TfdA family dioxygenase [Parasphingopyxis algicola]|uniref:TauD/TfdA dioxygenase family protein n=1 Tax=Parasphingopyxis algicola TaxID=2026624 RepID=UPI0015A0D1D7|nr:TauD/TfdA family dioxygenase [Parasphingopyxis algicola]QLC26414.1 TauD/TfdA family dioxygenase [Parasphingopyxis algicola]